MLGMNSGIVGLRMTEFHDMFSRIDRSMFAKLVVA